MNPLEDRIDIDLEWFYSSQYFQTWEESYFSSLPVDNPTLYDACIQAAEQGSDGRTHQDIIDLWRDAWAGFCADKDISEEINNKVVAEISACEQWHIDNGSINNQLS